MELKKIFNEKNYEKLLLIRNKKTEDYYKVLLEQCHKIVTDCLKTVDRSKLKPITTANTYFTEIYNNFVNNKTNPYDLENKRIIGLFAEMIYFSMSMYEFLKKNKRNPFKIMLIEKCIRMESMMDSKTGNNILFSISPEYEFELRSTKTIPFKTESGHETYKVIEVENAPYKDSIKKEQLVFKTGNLLISDWFRIDEFTNTVKADRYISLNSEVGIEESIKHYIQKHGFISVNVGNTCPEILYRSGKIICGNMTDKKAKMV